MKIEKLMVAPLFKGFEEEELALLLFSGCTSPRTYPSGTIMHLQGDVVKGLHILVEGRVKTTMGNDDGKVITVETIDAPSAFAPAFVFASDNHFPVNVIADTDCEVIMISRERMLDMMSKNPQFMENVLRDISDRNVFLTHRLRQFAITNLKRRILEYLKEHGPIKNQVEVAQILGVARPSLSRALAELEREGKI